MLQRASRGCTPTGGAHRAALLALGPDLPPCRQAPDASPSPLQLPGVFGVLLPAKPPLLGAAAELEDAVGGGEAPAARRGVLCEAWRRHGEGLGGGEGLGALLFGTELQGPQRAACGAAGGDDDDDEEEDEEEEDSVEEHEQDRGPAPEVRSLDGWMDGWMDYVSRVLIRRQVPSSPFRPCVRGVRNSATQAPLLRASPR